MINATELRKGVIIELENKLYQVMEYQHVKMKRTALARVKLRDIQGGHTIERTFQSGDKFARARLDHRTVQYLYNDGNLYYFMDEETYEQMPLNAEQLDNATDYLKEGMSLGLTSYKGELMGVIKFGSRVDLLVPDSYQIEVAPGDKTVEGLTVLARRGPENS